jgi:hypothetical protein
VIYSRFGMPVTIERKANSVADVRNFDHRKPDQVDRDAIRNGSYVIVRFEDGKRQLYHLAYLRADGGIAEIMAAILDTER